MQRTVWWSKTKGIGAFENGAKTAKDTSCYWPISALVRKNILWIIDVKTSNHIQLDLSEQRFFVVFFAILPINHQPLVCWPAWSWKHCYWHPFQTTRKQKYIYFKKKSSMLPLSPDSATILFHPLYRFFFLLMMTQFLMARLTTGVVDPGPSSRLAFFPLLPSAELLLDATNLWNWLLLPLTQLHSLPWFFHARFASAVWGVREGASSTIKFCPWLLVSHLQFGSYCISQYTIKSRIFFLNVVSDGWFIFFIFQSCVVLRKAF